MQSKLRQKEGDLQLQKLIFFHGKGGVGKSFLALGLARALRDQGRSVLVATLDEPTLPPGDHLYPDEIPGFNCIPSIAFEEYIERTLKIPAITRILAKNTLIQLLAKVAPGIKEIVSIGKIWSLRDEHDAIVIDLPSSGYGLTLFHSVRNFMRLFGKGRSFEDSRAMLETLSDPNQVLHVLVTLAEEMPLVETDELRGLLVEQFPKANLLYAINRLLPLDPGPTPPLTRDDPRSAEAFLYGRAVQERENLGRFSWTASALRFWAGAPPAPVWRGFLES